MKKLLTALCLLTVLTTAVFAETNSFKLNGMVTEIPYTLNVRYNNNVLANDSAIYSDTVTPGDEKNAKWDITQNGETKQFAVVLSGNQNSAASFSASVIASNFKGTVNGKTNTDSNVAVNIKKDSVVDTTVNERYGLITAENEVLYSFSLEWLGNPNAAACDDYTSTVTITYSTNA